MARFEISLPPSANSAYINIPGRGRARSASHEKWKNSAGWEIQIQRVPKVAGHYAVNIFAPQKMRGDIDGRIKLILDLLVEMGVTPDDRFCDRCSIERSGDVTAGRVIVEVEDCLSHEGMPES